jgi:hypothetical protein
MKKIKIVVTSLNAENLCRCQYCNKTIAEFKDDKMIPSSEECYNKGNVPIPNFGWFCSQVCANNYEAKNDIKFARTEKGKIDYYRNNAND